MKRLAIPALLLIAACKIPIGTVPCTSDVECATGQICGTDGTCQTAPACTATQLYCNHQCVDATSTSNCGACGNVCQAGFSCINETCTLPLGSVLVHGPDYAYQGATGLTATAETAYSDMNDGGTESFAWTISGGTFSDGTASATGQTVTFNAGTGAAVVLTATATAPGGQQATGSKSVSLVPVLPTISITTPCTVSASQAGIAATATAVAGATYAWTILNGTLANNTGSSVTYTAGAGGQVTLSVTVSSLACTADSCPVPQARTSAQTFIQISPMPGQILISTVPSVAVGTSGVAASIAASAAPAGVTVTWSITGGTFDPNQTSQMTGTNSVTYTAGLGPSVILNVTATNSAGASQTGTATVPVTIPTAGNLTATGGANQITLRWDGVPGATKYHVLRASSASATPTQLNDSGTTNYTDGSLPNGKRYYYQVVAATDFVMGSPSVTASAVTALPAPTNLAASNGQSIPLTWTGVQDATKYNIFRKTGAANYAVVGSSTTTSFTDSNSLTQGVQYTYVVHALTADNESMDSNSATAITTLNAPAGLTATPNAYDITLNWTANPAATGYDIFRSNSAAGPFTQIDSTSTNTYCNCSNTSSPPAPSTTYYYEVRATTANTVSGFSNIANATTALPPPGNVSGEVDNRNTIVLTWAPVDGATGYGVERATSPDGPFVLIGTTDANTTTYTDANLPYGTTFYYQIVSYNGTTYGPPSSPPLGVMTDVSPYKAGANVFGGEVQAVAIDPNSGTVWAGTNGGAGLYSSTDQGTTWTATTGLAATSVHALAFSKGALFAGSRNAGVFGQVTQGGATTWVAANNGLVATDTYNALAADPGNSGTLYAASYAGIYTTANNGVAWTATAFQPPAPVTALAVSPTDPKTVYAATDGSGLFVSTNGGASWSALGPANANIQGGVAIDPANAGHLWIGTANGVFVSSDGGQTWAAVGSLTGVRALAWNGSNTLYASNGASGIMFGDGATGFASIGSLGPATVGVVALAASGPVVIAGSLGGLGIFHTLDGKGWTPAGKGVTAASVPAIGISLANNASLFAVAGYRVIKSTDHGATWASAMGTTQGGNVAQSGTVGLSYPVITSALALDPNNAGTVYIGAQGIARTTDSGNSWSSTNANFDATSLSLASSTVAYAAAFDIGVYKTTNLTAATPTWTLVNTGLNGTGIRAVAAASATQVYAGGDHGFWSTANGGTSWTAPAQQLSHVRSITVHPTAPGTVFAVVEGGLTGSQLRKSTDAGATWSDLGFGSIAVQNLTGVSIDPTNPSILFAVGSSSNGGSGGLYKSTDAGATWKDISSGIGTRQLDGVLLDPVTSGTLFVATDNGGVMVSTSGGL